jgi:hypothetical protein
MLAPTYKQLKSGRDSIPRYSNPEAAENDPRARPGKYLSAINNKIFFNHMARTNQLAHGLEQ